MEGIEKRYINLVEAARYLGLSTKTVYVWAERKRIPAHKVGRLWRFDVAELDRFVHEPAICYDQPVVERAVGLGG